MKSIKKPKIVKRKASERAGLIFPVSRIGRFLRQGNFAPNVSVNAAIQLAAALELLVRELLEISVDVTKKHEMRTITPRFIQEGMEMDADFRQLMNDNKILCGGQPKDKRAKNSSVTVEPT